MSDASIAPSNQSPAPQTSGDADHPLVTFALFAYNQERFIREAVEGAFAQTYSPLELILSDDCSTDGTFEIMRRMAATYRGHHRIILNRNTRNLGIGEHVYRIFQIAHGKIIVTAAGDDVSEARRVSAIAACFSLHPDVLAVVSSFTYINASSAALPGRWTPHADAYSLGNFSKGVINTPGAAAAWSRDLVTRWPALHNIVHEDRVLPFRALLAGGLIVGIDDVLVSYRRACGVSQQRLSNKETPVQRRLRQLDRIIPDARRRIQDYQYAGPRNSELSTTLHRYMRLIVTERQMLRSRNWSLLLPYILLALSIKRHDILYQSLKMFAKHIYASVGGKRR